MVIETTYQVGNYEPFEETIRYYLSSNWTPSQTNNVTPVFLSPNGLDSQVADLTKETSQGDIRTKKASGLLIFESTELIPLETPSNLSTTFETPVKITVYAASKYEMGLFLKQINDIIKENMPAGNFRIKKSDGIQDSGIAYFRNRKGVKFSKPLIADKEGLVFISTGSLSVMHIETKTS